MPDLQLNPQIQAALKAEAKRKRQVADLRALRTRLQQVKDADPKLIAMINAALKELGDN